MTVRHHKNPLLRHFCPNVYNAFREKDIVYMSSNQHSYYHNMLATSSKFQYLLGVSEELDNDRICSELDFADVLDQLWNDQKAYFDKYLLSNMNDNPDEEAEQPMLLATDCEKELKDNCKI